MRTDDRWDIEIRDRAEFGALIGILSGVTYTKRPDAGYVALYGEDPHALERLRDAISGGNLPRSFPVNVSISSRTLENMEAWAMWKAQQCANEKKYRDAGLYEERAKDFHQAHYVRI